MRIRLFRLKACFLLIPFIVQYYICDTTLEPLTFSPAPQFERCDHNILQTGSTIPIHHVDQTRTQVLQIQRLEDTGREGSKVQEEESF
jgi:hypothetical protein